MKPVKKGYYTATFYSPSELNWGTLLWNIVCLCKQGIMAGEIILSMHAQYPDWMPEVPHSWTYKWEQK